MTAEFKPLTEKSNPSQKHAGQALGAPVNRSRRRLVSGVGGGVGVLLSVHAKTALGTTVCQSPSAAFSGNTSNHQHGPENCIGGRSPGFWKVYQHFQYWRGATPATFNIPIKPCATGLGNVSFSDISDQGTIASAIFGSGAPSEAGFWAVLAFPTMWNKGELLRTLISAYLNAGYWGASYPITVQQTLDMWTAVSVPGGRYCPNTSCGSNGWTEAEVIAYIKGLYDDYTAVVDGDLCKKT